MPRALATTACLMLLPLSALAAGPTRYVCTGAPEYDYDAAYYPTLTKTCSDIDTPFETCTAFALSASGKPALAYGAAQAGIRTVDGVLEFHPAGLSSFERRTPKGAQRLWVLTLVDNSGSPSGAEERFAILDGAFKPVAPLMDYAAKDAFMRKQSVALAPMEAPLDCTPAQR